MQVDGTTIIGSILVAIISIFTSIGTLINVTKKDNTRDKRLDLVEKRLTGEEFMKHAVCTEVQNRMTLQFVTLGQTMSDISNTMSGLDEKMGKVQITLVRLEKNGG